MGPVRTEALVIKTSDYSESTRLVTLFSPDHGRIRLLAKGCRRLKSRDRGALEPFSRIQATFYIKDPTGLGTLKESAPIAGPTAFRDDYDRWLLASLVLEIIDRATLPGEDLGGLFDLVCDYLDEMKTTGRMREATAAALISMLSWFGVGPRFDRCGLCGGGEPFAGFVVDRCSVICRRCAGSTAKYRPLPPGTIRVLEELARSDAAARSRLHISPVQVEQVFSVLVAAVQHHLDISLATARMLSSGSFSPQTTRSSRRPKPREPTGRS